MKKKNTDNVNGCEGGNEKKQNMTDSAFFRGQITSGWFLVMYYVMQFMSWVRNVSRKKFKKFKRFKQSHEAKTVVFASCGKELIS